ncbi:hypothetical protein GCM10027282_07160 [Frigoribacterium salinisoli]
MDAPPPAAGAEGTEAQGPPAVAGRGTGIALAIPLPIALVVGWTVQLGTLLGRDFGSSDGRAGETTVLVGLLAGAVLGVGAPVAVLVLEARARRRDPRRSSVAFAAAIVVLVIGVLTSGLVAGAQVPVAIADLHRRAQPPTEAESRHPGQEAGDELRRIGDGTVVALGGDPAVGRDGPGAAARLGSEECVLDNGGPGVSWRYSYAADQLVDDVGAPLLPEGADEIPGTRSDLGGVREFWAGEGIGADRDDVGFDQVVPVSDQLERWSYARSGPTVVLVGTCVVP